MHRLRNIVFYLSVMLLLGGLCALWPEDGIALKKKDAISGQQITWHTLRFPKLNQLLTLDGDTANTPFNPIERIKKLSKSLTLGEKEQAKTKEDSICTTHPLSEWEKKFITFVETNPARIELPYKDYHYFDELFARMDSCATKGELIHISHYGDSQIEADRITSHIRKRLQDKFGGMGPGLLPVVKNDGGSYSVKWRSSQGFEKYVIDGNLQRVSMNKRYGALAQYVQFKGDEYFHLQSRMSHLADFTRIRLFVGKNGANFTANLHCDQNGKNYPRKIEEANDGATVINWSLPHPTNAFSVKLHGDAEIYGITLEDASGIAVDNIPMRGSRGTFFTRMDASLFTFMHKELNTQLILLEFGGNAMPLIKSEEDVKAYRQLIDMQIKWIKNACPWAKMILMGPSDMSEMINGSLQSRPFLEENIASMRECALENNICFWNMYEVMGGRNSMQEWVNQNPQLAATDYTHFNNVGAEMIAKLFVDSWSNYYDYYQKSKEAQ